MDDTLRRAMYSIGNRRYTGSKLKLLDEIETTINRYCTGEVFFDVFAGTGVVSDRMRKGFSRVIVNDFLFSNEIIYKAFFGNGAFDARKLDQYQKKYKAFYGKDLSENYFSINFGEKYFSKNDAKIIGAIRENLNEIRSDLTEREFCILLASLIYSADRIANTVGHYDAFRKIERIEDRFAFDLIEAHTINTIVEIYREDANQLVRKVRADVAFIDPPYNSRQYSRFYHVLENLAKWDMPILTGTALKPPPENMSDYCRNAAPQAFDDLIQNVMANFIVVTYNNTYYSKSSSSKNKISLEEIETILNQKGKTRRIEKSHPFFNAGKTEFSDHKEYIFVTEVR